MIVCVLVTTDYILYPPVLLPGSGRTFFFRFSVRNFLVVIYVESNVSSIAGDFLYAMQDIFNKIIGYTKSWHQFIHKLHSGYILATVHIN